MEPRRSSIGPWLESLESRQLLAASLLAGEVQIFGTHKADFIRVYVDPKAKDQIIVQVNREVTRFPVAAITCLNVQAGQGDDIVRIEGAAPWYAFDTRLYGSNGDDTITGGTGVDRVYGGSGNDSIDGGYGRDIIYGEGHNDSIWGNQGNDYLAGGSGNDTLFGDSGIDQMFGQEGDDLIEAEDSFFDRVDGGFGTDRTKVDVRLDSTFSIETFLL